MKKKVIAFILMILVFIPAVFAQESSKVLVVYYSRDGHTKMVGDEIAAQSGAVIEQLIDTKKRSGALGTMGAGNDAIQHKTTVLEPVQNDPAGFDIIIIGTPAWFGNMTPAVRTYLTEHRLMDKKVYFFATCHRVGGDKATRQMADLVYGEKAHDEPQLPLTHADLKSADFKEKVGAFLKQIG